MQSETFPVMLSASSYRCITVQYPCRRIKGRIIFIVQYAYPHQVEPTGNLLPIRHIYRGFHRLIPVFLTDILHRHLFNRCFSLYRIVFCFERTGTLVSGGRRNAPASEVEFRTGKVDRLSPVTTYSFIFFSRKNPAPFNSVKTFCDQPVSFYGRMHMFQQQFITGDMIRRFGFESGFCIYFMYIVECTG